MGATKTTRKTTKRGAPHAPPAPAAVKRTRGKTRTRLSPYLRALARGMDGGISIGPEAADGMDNILHTVLREVAGKLLPRMGMLGVRTETFGLAMRMVIPGALGVEATKAGKLAVDTFVEARGDQLRARQQAAANE